MIQYIFFQRVNNELWFTFTVDTDQHTNLFVLPNDNAQTLIQQLENGQQDTHTLTNETTEIALSLDYNAPLFYAISGQPVKRFIRRIAKPQTAAT